MTIRYAKLNKTFFCVMEMEGARLGMFKMTEAEWLSKHDWFKVKVNWIEEK